MFDREYELNEIIEDLYGCYDVDGTINPEEFAEYAKEEIEDTHGEMRFDDFNIISYAKDYAEKQGE